ncbi:MAG: PDZ domain-containing protein, partial [Opitutaceae bacterium]
RTGRRGVRGGAAQDDTPPLAEALGLKDRRGALVADVQPGSPAAKAGLRNGDVITELNGEKVEDANRLTFKVGAIPPGAKVELEVIRDGESRTIKATTAERTAAALRGDASGGPEALASNDDGVLNGVTVDDLKPQVRNQLNLPARLKGALITEVDPASAAAKAGLRPGDVILEINRQPVNSARDAVEFSAKAEGKKTLLRLFSRGTTLFVVVDETAKDSAQ